MGKKNWASEMNTYGPLFDKNPSTQGGMNFAPSSIDRGYPARTDGEQLKEKGIREVSEHNENWMEQCLNVAKWFVFQHGLTGEFTGEDIRLYCVDHGHTGNPKSPNAWGALINTLIRRKIIVPTGEHRKMKDSRSHARSTPVYKSV